MAVLVVDCPRCGARRMTFDVRQQLHTSTAHGWQHWYEAFCVCRACNKSTTFVLSQEPGEHVEVVHSMGLLEIPGALNDYLSVEGYISLRDQARAAPPDHVPNDIKAAFYEAATCLTVKCWNASASMFRACVDLATRDLLPPEGAEGLNARTRRDLGLRLPWLFDRGLLPPDLRELSTCIREDGNDGVHAVNLGKADAEDLLDFTTALLERLYTEPKRLELAQARRKARRQPK